MKNVTRPLCIAVILCGLILMLLSCAAYAQEEPPPPVEGEQPAIHVYFYLDGELVPVEREVPGGGQMVEFTVLDLLKGPSDEEKAEGYLTCIPEGVKLQYSTVKQDRTEYSVCLSRELLELKGDEEGAAKALAQIEKTTQEASGAVKIGITVAGEEMGSQPEDAYVALGVSREEDQEPAGSSKTVLIIAIVIGAVIAALLIFLAFYIPRKRRSSSTRSKTGKKGSGKRAKG